MKQIILYLTLICVAILLTDAGFAQEAAAPVTQNTVTTTGPVNSATTISVGTLASQVLTWAAAAFVVPVGAVLTGWLVRLFRLAGVQVASAMETQLQSSVVNGLNAAAANLSGNLVGKGSIAVKSAIVADAVKYVQDHRADTIQALGLDPKSGAAVEAIKARIETAIADPAQPTPKVLAATPIS